MFWQVKMLNKFLSSTALISLVFFASLSVIDQERCREYTMLTRCSFEFYKYVDSKKSNDKSER
jgi:hypothetical protein